MSIKELVCIVCPRGCHITVTNAASTPEVSGNFCKRGKDFALAEITCPMRTICTTVPTVFPDVPVLPVRVSADIPKDKIRDVMNAINSATVTERLGRNDTVIENVCNLGVNVISESNILKESEG